MPLLDKDFNKIKMTTDPTLDLTARGLVDPDIPELVHTLDENTHITTIKLALNNIGNEGAQLLAGLKHVECLDLSQNNVGNPGVEALAVSDIKHLNLACNNITNPGGQFLSQHAKQLKLRIDRNNELDPKLVQKIAARIQLNAETAKEFQAPGNCSARLHGQ
jgi:hypothetical protein